MPMKLVILGDTWIGHSGVPASKVARGKAENPSIGFERRCNLTQTASHGMTGQQVWLCVCVRACVCVCVFSGRLCLQTNNKHEFYLSKQL